MVGIWFGVDVGTVRVGVARCDPNATIAVPVTTLARDRQGGGRDVTELVALMNEYEAVGAVVGLPRHLSGAEGASARMARDYAQALGEAIAPRPVELVDERLTTSSAQRKLREAGRSTRNSRAVVDQVAAVEILQHWLDGCRKRPEIG